MHISCAMTKCMIVSQGPWFSSGENGGYEIAGLQCFTKEVKEQNFDPPSL